MKKGDRIFLMIFISIFIILLTVSVVSAGWWENFKRTITGRISDTGAMNTTFTITGANAVTISVWNSTLTGIGPSEAGATNVEFNVTVADEDGIEDINDSSVTAKFQKAGETTRENTTACSQIDGETTDYAQNYTCYIDMWYWDGTGEWTINVTANDKGNKTYISNDSMVFTYGPLTAMVISPSTIDWPASGPGETNVVATHNTTINNTGNYDVEAGNVTVNGTNLYGATGVYLDVGNFTVDTDSGTGACDGQALSHATFQGITNSNITAGNLSLGGGTAQEVIYYCLNEVPLGLPSQAYSTSEEGGSAWIVKIV